MPTEGLGTHSFNPVNACTGLGWNPFSTGEILCGKRSTTDDGELSCAQAYKNSAKGNF